MIRTTIKVVCLLLAVLLWPARVQAHQALVRSSPPAGASLAVAPREIQLTFNEPPERLLTRVSLTGPSGAMVPLDSIVPGLGNTMTVVIRGALSGGLYRVHWQSAGRDGHPVQGDYEFSIMVGAPGTVDAAVAQDHAASAATEVRAPAFAGTPEVLAPFAAVLRWLTLAGVIAAVGATMFRIVVLGRVEMDSEIAAEYITAAARGAALLGLAAAASVALVAVAQLGIQSVTLHGVTRGVDPRVVAEILTGTMWGVAWMVKVAMALIAVAAYSLAAHARRHAWVLAGGASVGMVLGLALSGHAVVVPRFVVPSVIAHLVHTVAAAGWLGTLLLVVAIGLPYAFRLNRDARWTAVADIVHAFSPVALAFAALAVVAGVFIAWTHMGAISALWTTEYGQILLLKLGLLAVTALIGAYNWLRVRPTLGDFAGARRLRRTAVAELVFAALVLGVTAVLVATPMPVS